MLIAEEITVDWEQDGCYLHVDGETWRVADPEALYDHVKAAILPWLMERDEALREWEGAREGRYAHIARTFECDPDESGGYDISDPKHPDFHSVHADIWDNRAGK